MVAPVPRPFAFEPDGGADLVERWSFTTDILTARTGRERRVRLAQLPRIGYQWLVSSISSDEVSTLYGTLWNGAGANRWLVPQWAEARPIASAGESAGVYPIDLTATNFVVGESALVWRKPDQYDVMVVEAVNAIANTVTLSGVKTFIHTPGSMVVPILPGSLLSIQPLARASVSALATVALTCDVANTAPRASGVAPQSYRGVEVLPELYVGDTVQDNWNIRESMSGGQASSPFIVRPLDTYPTLILDFTWVATSRLELQDLRQFLLRRGGRYAPVWAPTMVAECFTTAPGNVGATTLATSGFNYNPYYTGEPTRQYGAVYAGGRLQPFRIIDWSDGVLTFEEPLALPIPAGAGIAFLRFCRLAEDNIEMIVHPGMSSCTCEMRFQEIPLETLVSV